MKSDEIFHQGSEIIGEGVLDNFLYTSRLTLMIDYGLTIDYTLSHL